MLKMQHISSTTHKNTTSGPLLRPARSCRPLIKSSVSRNSNRLVVREASTNGAVVAPASASMMSLDLTSDEVAKVKNCKVAVFSAQQYVKDFLEAPLKSVFPSATLLEPKLDEDTAALAEGYDAVVAFVNDVCTDKVIAVLADVGVKLIALRCAGFDRVDLKAAAQHGIKVARVPTYSPQSVAEHAVSLMFALNRNLHNAYLRTLQGNYSLSGLVGFEMHSKTVGVVGTGAIGVQACRILKGIGCRVLAYDIAPNPAVLAMGIEYRSLDDLMPECDIITLHCPLLPSTYHIMNRDRIAKMKRGAMLINVSRGGLLDSDALSDALESGQIGSLGLDVYENEGSLFFVDYTMYETKDRMRAWDRRFRSLLTYPQVMVTPHSAFLTKEALSSIARVTIQNISDFYLGKELGKNEVKYTPPKK